MFKDSHLKIDWYIWSKKTKTKIDWYIPYTPLITCEGLTSRSLQAKTIFSHAISICIQWRTITCFNWLYHILISHTSTTVFFFFSSLFILNRHTPCTTRQCLCQTNISTITKHIIKFSLVGNYLLYRKSLIKYNFFVLNINELDNY